VSWCHVPSGIVERAVEDDGTGFDTEASVKGSELGTKILNAVEAAMGGELTYDRTSSAGTDAGIIFPI
jgi:nitrate/nitrite-specific signal transduction histidine kinase